MYERICADRDAVARAGGFGRVGQAVADVLTAKLVRYKAFDLDPYRVQECRERRLPGFSAA